MTNFNEELGRVLRYSMDTVENLVSQLASPENAHHRWGGPDADHTFRGVVADALRDADRHKEADLLNDPNQHVVVDGGRVRAGRFTGKHLERGIGAVEEAAEQVTGDDTLANYLHRHHIVYYPLMSSGDLPHHTLIEYVNGRHHIPPHKLGETLAKTMGDTGAEFDDALGDDEHFQEALHKLRTAPYEEVDHTHPSEQQ